MYTLDSTLVGFDGTRRIARGTPVHTALQAASHLATHPDAHLLFFNTATGRQVELDLRGSADAIRQRLETPPLAAGPGDTAPVRAGKGRPRLGVVAREVTLLPRHWDWLAQQPGGASVTLRKLIEGALRRPDARAAREARATAAYHFMLAVAGNAPGFEAVSRALFAGQQDALQELLQNWPADVAEELLALYQGGEDAGPQDAA